MVLLFFSVPLLEIYLLLKIGGVIGALPTIGLVVLTAVIGAFLLRQQGFATLARIQSELNRGEVPAVTMLEGAALLFGGALLLTPGFFTDTLGFLCLLPVTRRPIVQWLLRRAVIQVRNRHPGQRPGQRVFEGEYRNEQEPDPPHGSP
jgi:UPF0716 protein FxsA